MYIKNKQDIIDRLVELLKQFDISLNRYQTDVYLYLDDDGNASLDTFVNVGGNSWLDDDHYTIYSDKEHYDTFIDFWTTIGELAEALEVSEEKFIEDVANFYHMDIEDVGYVECHDYICDHEKLFDKLAEIYTDYICNQLNAEYAEKAEHITDSFIEEQEYIEHMRKYG